MSIFQITIAELSILSDSLYTEYDFGLLAKKNFPFSAELQAVSKKIDKIECTFYKQEDLDGAEALTPVLISTFQKYLGEGVKPILCDTQINDMFFSSDKTLLTLPMPRAEFFALVITDLEQKLLQPSDKAA